ncbi:putative harbinger transposase-derived nuclease domain-containing protein [Tanacetum coccineum]
MTGYQYTQELLEGNNLQCTELLRMSRDSFVRLCTHFKTKDWLKDSKHVSVEEKMAIFLMTIGHNHRFTVLKRRFQCSKQTIHKCFHEILDQMLVFAQEVIQPTSFSPNSDIPGNNRREWRVGALDGTLIHASVLFTQQHLYRARGRGDCYQNVLAICDFNMIFTYVVVGWEGTAHDARILNEALIDPEANFPMPHSDKYYLCDAAYRHTCGFMAPYWNVRYWLGDFCRNRAMNSREKFNHVHAKLRNERAFGVLKTRFPILKKMPSYPLVTQRDITLACFAIPNFILSERLSDEFFPLYDHREVHGSSNSQDDNVVDRDVQPYGSAADQEYMTSLRDSIAAQYP